MPGSVGNPVVLDPFRTIIEVGWNFVTHIAVKVVVVVDNLGGHTSVPLDVPNYEDITVTIPDADWDVTWLIVPADYAAHLLFVGSDVYQSNYQQLFGKDIQTASAWKKNSSSPAGGSWIALDADDYTYTGLPDMEATGPVNIQALVNSPAYTPYPDVGWQDEPGGTGDGMHIPGDDTKIFDQVPNPSWRFYLNAIWSEGPYWARGPGSSKGYGGYTSHFETDIINKVFSDATFTITHKGQNYRPVASYFVPGEPDLWVLLKKQTS
ncbi:hypothetical protein [Rhizobium leguminosarum]|uniref:hypothetical protein n=1 Tax=Rhizobium leguminosarum TaxID=384 RepID=UPI00036168C8|nr:hypothetical protein [Rhizobium leguminosarum]